MLDGDNSSLEHLPESDLDIDDMCNETLAISCLHESLRLASHVWK